MYLMIYNEITQGNHYKDFLGKYHNRKVEFYYSVKE